MPRPLACLALLAVGMPTAAPAGQCEPQSVHVYLASLGAAAASRALGAVAVADTNAADCDLDGTPGDFDGDHDAGVGGAFFGHGAWAKACGYDLNEYGPDVRVVDAALGASVAFLVGEDDTFGPHMREDPETGEVACSTSGSITPGDPFADPTADADDCLAGPFVGQGRTCGHGGGDGGYWVILAGPATTGYVLALDWGATSQGSPPGEDARLRAVAAADAG